MNDFEGLLPPDYGFKPQGKSAPMASTNPSPTSSRSSGSFTGSYRIGPDSVFGAKINQKSQAFDEFGDIFKNSELRGGGNSSINVDSMTGSASKSSSNMPVFDKPVYDDDIFKGVPGLKSSDGVKYDTIFASKKESGSGRSDYLLAGLGKKEDSLKVNGSKNTDFDDLLRGFRSSPSTQRHTKEFDMTSRPTINSNKKMGNHFMGNGSTSPHVLSFSGLSTDPLEEINKLGSSGSTKISGQSATNMGLYDDLDPFDSFRKPMPSSLTEKNNRVRDGSFLMADSSTGDGNRYSSRSTGNHSRRTTPVNRVRESQQTFSEIPRFSSFTRQSTIQNASSPSYENGNSTEANIHADGMESSDEVWLTVSEIPLFTQPTNAPPPSRPPPPRPARASKVASSSFGSRNGKISSSSSHFTSLEPVCPASRSSAASSVDELEDFATGRRNNNFDDLADGLSSENLNMNSVAASSAAAMKEAMERAEVKFRHAKETWKRENSRSSRSRENVHLEKDESVEGVFREKQERSEHEWLERKQEEEEREHKRLEKERKWEDKEREQRTLEREMARLAVGKATREARERAAAEARELTEKAAVQRAQAEARERAANEAKEKAERAAAEARDREARKKAAEARMQAERAAVQRAAAEARERAARDAREAAAAAAAAGAASASQQNNANDLDSIFNMGSQAPRTWASASESAFDAQFQSREGPGAGKTSATTQSSNAKKVSSTANFVDDLTIFSGAASSRDFQEVEGETEERRRARLERHQRTQERAANALAEKNQRDLQTQREQEERHRIAETLDIEIKRWATGKEGNLRALLSTLQYVLWPECGWQPVSLTDLITAAAVKKVYRKATLCIHPDKVQQKGANLQQKYIAEKIFDLLKEAWNKFNSEELF